MKRPHQAVYVSGYSGLGVFIRRYALPALAAGAGLAIGSTVTLWWTSLTLAALAGWLATYSP